MEQVKKYQGPLAGLNVIDFGHYYAGPMAGMLLADQGANVIGIRKPGKPEITTQQYRLLNRNKKLLTLDLKTTEGKAHALSLVERADIVIENFRPGVMKRLGLDYANIKNKNSQLIYLSLPGFASTDKERCHIQAWEGILSAAAGVFDPRDFYQKLNFPPVYDPVPICSAAGAIQGVIAVMSALIAREDTGFGTICETPLFDAGLSVYANFFSWESVKNPELGENEVRDEIKKFAYSTDDSRESTLDKIKEINDFFHDWLSETCYYSKYHTTSDGRTALIWTWEWSAQVERLLKVLGIDQQVKREGFVNLGPWENGLDNNLTSIPMSLERTQRIMRLVSDALATKTAAEWDSLMESARVPFGIVYTQDEWLSLPIMQSCGVNITMDDGRSALSVPGRIVDVSGPGGVVMTNYHEVQSISAVEADAILTAAMSSEEESPPQQKGNLLKRLKVLDLCNIVAGPTATSTLAQFGADVIKADPAHESASLMRFMLEQNQGKRSIITDVRTAPGRQVFERLIKWADIVVHNILDDTAYRLGISPEQLRRVNSRVVSCQVSTYGGTHRGAWEKRLGSDQMAKIATGMKTRFGTVDNPQGPPSEWMIADIMGGLCLAFSGLLALYQQRKTGYAGEGRASLVRGNNYIYLPHMILENGRSDRKTYTLMDKGEYWWQRLYQCSDGWLYVGTSEERAGILAEKLIGKTSADDKLLEEAFARQDCSYWQAKLDEEDIACHRVLTLNDLIEEAEVQKVGNEAANDTARGKFKFLSYQNHPCGKPVTTIAPTWTRVGEGHSYHRLTPAPRLGTHTREILSELGYSEDEIEELVRLKVAHEYLPRMGSKYKYFFEPDEPS